MKGFPASQPVKFLILLRYNGYRKGGSILIPGRNYRHKQVGIAASTRMYDMLAFVAQVPGKWFIPAGFTDIAAGNNQAKLLSRMP
jgi:hypothetical protein